MSENSPFADNRAVRRDHAGISGGAATGGVLGLLLGSLVPGVGSLAGLAAAVALGAAAGAAAGKAAVARASVDDWDPTATARPYVGAHTPDTEASDVAEPRR